MAPPVVMLASSAVMNAPPSIVQSIVLSPPRVRKGPMIKINVPLALNPKEPLSKFNMTKTGS